MISGTNQDLGMSHAIELRRAHQANDRAAMQACGFKIKMNEAACIAELMNLYKDLELS